MRVVIMTSLKDSKVRPVVSICNGTDVSSIEYDRCYVYYYVKISHNIMTKYTTSHYKNIEIKYEQPCDQTIKLKLFNSV